MRWLFCTPFLPTCCICSTELPSLIQFIHTRTQAKKPNYQQIPHSKAQVFFPHANKLLFCLSFTICSSCLQKYSCAFNKEVPVHFAVRCLMGTWTQKINSARHGTDSSYPPHLPPLNFTGNGISRPLDAKHKKQHVLISLNGMCTWDSLTNTSWYNSVCTNTWLLAPCANILTSWKCLAQCKKSCLLFLHLAWQLCQITCTQGICR